MNRRSSFWAGVFGIFIFGAVCWGATITVALDGSGDYTTIQEAIDAAVNGDEIEVSFETHSSQLNQSIDFAGKDIIIRNKDSKESYISKSKSNYSNSIQDYPALKLNYVTNEIIIKFNKTIADKFEEGISTNKQLDNLGLSNSLDILNQRYKLRSIKAVFKDFKQTKKKIEGLSAKDESLLTKREKHILARLKRATKGAKVPSLDRIYKLEVELEQGQTLEEAVEAYSKDPDVEYSELNYIFSINLTPNDPLYSVQWPLNNTGQMYPESGRYNHPPGMPDCDIDAPEAWDKETGSSEIILAVVDTGVDYTHRDLEGSIWTNEIEMNGDAGVDDDGNGYIDDFYGYDFINSDCDPMDDHGHGTHCSGTISARGNNGLDITGICWSTRIMGLKFLSSSGKGSSSDAMEAFYYAVNSGADIVSNSWGGGGYSESMEEAIEYAYSQGVIMIASAGNNNSSSPQYPAYYEHMIAVAATDSNDERAPFSNYGEWVEIAAPGVDVLSLRASGTSMGTVNDSFTTIASGTSMACPHVSGACALLLSLYPEGFVDEITNILQESTDPIEPEICQSGRLNIDKAILKTVTPEGRIWLDKEMYSCSGQVKIYITDSDLKGAGFEDVVLTTDGNDFETVTLLEDGSNTGIFCGSIDLSGDTVVVEDGTLQVAHGQTISATYYDADDGTGSPKTAEDEAEVDCVSPVVLDIDVTLGLSGRSATVRIETDEPTAAEVSCGLSCGGSYDIVRTDSVMSTNHTINLLPLTSETDYYFVIRLVDAAGNELIDDNEGQCYSFTTPEFLGFLVPSVFPTIQAAIDETWDGDTVWVADGTYSGEGNYEIVFSGKEITVRSENGPSNCVIDCDNLGRGFDFSSEYNENAILDGFTIINGNASEGGGIRCLGVLYADQLFPSSPTIRNCIIYDCSASKGGGVYFRYSLSSLTDCDISNNDGGSGIYDESYRPVVINNCRLAGNAGNGIYGYDSRTQVGNCTITENFENGIYARWGTMTIKDCIIANHKCSGIGFLYAGATVDNCTISNNNNSAIDYDCSRLNLSNSVLIGNYSSDYGGGIKAFWDQGTIVENCVIIGNRAAEKGGGVWSNPDYEHSDIRYTNCTIIDNECNIMGGGLSLGSYSIGITNCIIWGNTAPTGSQVALHSGASVTNVSYCAVQYGQAGVYQGGTLNWGPGNIDEDPCFSLSGDYHILDDSPCIDMGTNNPSGGLAATDIYGTIRNLDGDNNGSAIADMGAYEYKYNSTRPIISISEQFFEFYNFNNEPNPDNQNLSIRNCGGGVLNWEITDDSFWLEAVPGIGVSYDDINDVALVVDTTTLSHGSYIAKLIITDTNALNSPKEILVKLNVADTISVPEHYPTIQEAIDSAGDGSTIIVADGLYTGPGNRDIDFRGKAITVKSENGPENCIIDCENEGRGFCFDTYEDNGSILDGFAIINGNASEGGGIHCRDSGPTIINCNIISSLTNSGGGGIYANNSDIQIINCLIQGNHARIGGGGLYLSHGGTVLIDSCIINCNSTEPLGKGGGIYITNDAGGVFENCMIADNFGGIEGGAFYSYNGPMTIQNSTISGNSVSNLGGLFCLTFSRILKVSNSILWGNLPNDIYDKGGNSTPIYINFSDIQGGWPGTGNIDVEPWFVDAAGGDYHLLMSSPCVDAGDPAFTVEPDEVDIDGEPRVMGGRVDMGADEVGPKQADFTRDGVINIDDFGVLGNSWGAGPGDEKWYVLCDLWEDGVIGLEDVVVFVEDWMWTFN